MIQAAEKSIPCFFRCFFFFFFSAVLFIQEILQNPQNGKNKQTQLGVSSLAQERSLTFKISKFQDGAGNTELHRQSRSFEETDRSEIERKSTCSMIELLLSEALPGYDLLKMTIVLIRSSGI